MHGFNLWVYAANASCSGGDLSACVEHLAYVDYLNALSAAERWSAHIFNAPLAPQPPKYVYTNISLKTLGIGARVCGIQVMNCRA